MPMVHFYFCSGTLNFTYWNNISAQPLSVSLSHFKWSGYMFPWKQEFFSSPPVQVYSIFGSAEFPNPAVSTKNEAVMNTAQPVQLCGDSPFSDHIFLRYCTQPNTIFVVGTCCLTESTRYIVSPIISVADIPRLMLLVPAGITITSRHIVFKSIFSTRYHSSSNLITGKQRSSQPFLLHVFPANVNRESPKPTTFEVSLPCHCDTLVFCFL
jgi:hypothetical protein